MREPVAFDGTGSVSAGPSGPGGGEARPRKTLTIKEFAEAIGVSPTTVSRSITGRGRVNEDTRQMVLERMEELGYTPNLHAQHLVSGRARTVALCIGDQVAPTSDLFLVELMRGLQQALQAQDYALLLLGLGDGMKRWVNSRAVDGVILVGGREEDAELARAIVRPSVPCIVIGTSPLPAEPNIGSVYIDLADGAVQVARALVEQGHSRIGFIGSNYSSSVLPSFKAELKRLGIAFRDEWAIVSDSLGNLEDGEQAMQRLMALDLPPTAVFARTDILAIGALRAARKLNLEVPQRVSLIGHDDLTVASFVEPPLSTVHIDFEGIGQAVVDLLFNMLADPDALVPARAMATTLVLRGTVGPPPGQS